MSRDMFVWDTTGPLHATACEHADWLIEASGRHRHPVIPSKVSQEMADHGFPADEELFKIDELETIEDLVNLARWQDRLGSNDPPVMMRAKPGWPRWRRSTMRSLSLMTKQPRT